MLYNQRTLSALAAAGLFAAFAAQANKGAEYKPHHAEPHKNFFITGGATYLEPGQPLADYLGTTTYDLVLSGVTPSARSEVVQPEFNWGYYLAAGYRISHHYDIQASWSQFNSNLSDSDSVSHNPWARTDVVFGGDPLTLLVGQSVDATSSQTLDYSFADLNIGQYHDITEMLRARLLLGIAYAKVDATVSDHYVVNNFHPTRFETYPTSSKSSSTFNGVGPELGMELEYKLYRHLGLVGGLTTAFLVGQQDYNLSVTSSNLNESDVKAENTARVIPSVDAKLGLNWNVPYETHWGFAIEAGYQVAYYWDVILQGNTNSNGNFEYFDYGNMGPYLNLTAMF